MTLTLVWTMPPPPIRLVWYGPDGEQGYGPPANSARPLAAIIGPRGERGPAGPSGGVSQAEAEAIADAAALVLRSDPLILIEAMLHPDL
jgi:hypothetical protein